MEKGTTVERHLFSRICIMHIPKMSTTSSVNAVIVIGPLPPLRIGILDKTQTRYASPMRSVWVVDYHEANAGTLWGPGHLVVSDSF